MVVSIHFQDKNIHFCSTNTPRYARHSVLSHLITLLFMQCGDPSSSQHSHSSSPLFFVAALTHSSALALTFSCVFLSPFASSHSLHLRNHAFAALALSPFTFVTRSNNPLTTSLSPCLISKSSNWFQISSLFGNVESKPSNIVRPRSGEPDVEWNSRDANLRVRAR